MKVKYINTYDEKEGEAKAYYCRRSKVPNVDLYECIICCGHEFSIYRSYRKICTGGSNWYLYFNYDGRWWYINDEKFYYAASRGIKTEIYFEDVPSWEKTEGKPKRKTTTLIVDRVLVASKTIKEGLEASDSKNDCTVLAVAHGFEISYDKAYEYLKMLGREPNKGFRLTFFLRQWSQLRTVIFNKHVNIMPLRKSITLGTFIKENPNGTFILSISGHVNTLKNGKLLDYKLTARSRLYGAFEII